MPTIQLEDLALYYECYGEGEPLLLLHGLGSSARDWELQVPAFSTHYRLVVPDMRGHGRSGKPAGPYSVPLFAADIASLLRALGTGPAHVLGISMGGMIAFQLAVDAPELVRSLIIVNMGPELVPRTLGDRLSLLQRRLLFRLLSMRQIGRVIGGRLFPLEGQEGLRQTFEDRWAQNDKRAYMAATNGLVGWSVKEQLPALTMPTLVMASEFDYTPVSAKQAFLPLLPHGELAVIPGAHHAVPAEMPETFNQTVLAFLSGLPRNPP